MILIKMNSGSWNPDNCFLLEYLGRIESGEIIAGEELFLELKRLEADFQNDDYFYNRDKALLEFDFMENCIRLTKSPFYNQPMQLMLWQKAFIEALFSFKMAKESKDRKMMIDRFKKAILEIARKNGKSETSSGLGDAELITGNPGSDIVASSNDDAQASIVFDGMETMRSLFDPGEEYTHKNIRFILNKNNNSKIFKLSDRTRNKEGRNIDFAILDEAHEMKDNTIAKSIEQSQSLKDNPKFIIISTEGFVIDGYFDKELKFCRKIIRGELDDNPAAIRVLPWLYTQDSESEVWNGNRKNRLWMKSNPAVGVLKKWEYLEEQVALAKENKADRIFVLSKDFNIKQNEKQSWLNLEDFVYPNSYDLEEFRGSFCLGAVDLSETTDLTSAKILLMKKDDPKKYILSHYFIPESKLEEKPDEKSGAKYSKWAADGLITICEGNEIDLAVVADWFFKLYQDYSIRLWKCGYDQKFSNEWIKRMNFYGWSKGNTRGEDGELILILQNAQTLSNAIKLCEADFKHQLIFYNENEVDKWCFGNAGLLADAKGNSLIVKQETEKRIDGAVSLAILFEVYRRYRTDFMNLIEK